MIAFPGRIGYNKTNEVKLFCHLSYLMFDPKLKEALGRVQKPGRYTGGEPGSVYKD